MPRLFLLRMRPARLPPAGALGKAPCAAFGQGRRAGCCLPGGGFSITQLAQGAGLPLPPSRRGLPVPENRTFFPGRGTGCGSFPRGGMSGILFCMAARRASFPGAGHLFLSRPVREKRAYEMRLRLLPFPSAGERCCRWSGAGASFTGAGSGPCARRQGYRLRDPHIHCFASECQEGFPLVQGTPQEVLPVSPGKPREQILAFCGGPRGPLAGDPHLSGRRRRPRAA